MTTGDENRIREFQEEAAAEKLAAMQTEEFFMERRNRADRDAFRRILNRVGGASPSPGDEWEEDNPAILAR
jgi:hypothetical protein